MFDDGPAGVPDEARGGGRLALPPLGYQARDARVVDYGLTRHEASGLWFRGAVAPSARGDHITCVGAAQTFGCLCPEPWPDLVGAASGRPVVNLGYGGAGPRFFLDRPPLIEVMNAGALVVLQVMSGRSESNRLFEAGGLEQVTRRSGGCVLSADAAYAEILREHPPRLPSPLGRLGRVAFAPRPVRSVVAETKRVWTRNMLALIGAIRVPVVLLWFAKRRPWLQTTPKAAWAWQRYDSAGALLGGFPHLIGPRALGPVRRAADAYVEAVTARGSPHPLRDRTDGTPVTIDYGHNRPDLARRAAADDYYPSPQMHEDAAEALEPVLTRMLAEGVR